MPSSRDSAYSFISRRRSSVVSWLVLIAFLVSPADAFAITNRQCDYGRSFFRGSTTTLRSLRLRSSLASLQEASTEANTLENSSPSCPPPSARVSNTTTPALRVDHLLGRDGIYHLETPADLKILLLQQQHDNNTMTIVKVHAPWCKTCHAVAPRYRQLAQRHHGKSGRAPQFIFAALTTQDNGAFAKHVLNVTALPTILIYSGSEIVWSQACGSVGKFKLVQQKVEEYATKTKVLRTTTDEQSSSNNNNDDAAVDRVDRLPRRLARGSSSTSALLMIQAYWRDLLPQRLMTSPVWRILRRR
jgi:thiol-disulfide isomerase/thioredoxin